ncbi:MAG: hypothetical protein HAW60_04185 [Bdellovibrionales bacterium]|nr:hypothetical protein [Bdellovibrionales bacterium]
MNKINYILLSSLIICLPLHAKQSAKQNAKQSAKQNAKKENDLVSILENKSSKQVDSLFLSNQKLYGFTIKTSEQKQFASLFKKALYKKALYQWKSAFAKTSFSYSATGQALFSYLLWKNKFFITGVKKLFAIKHPNKINKQIVSKWKLELKNNMHNWVKTPKLNWTKKWSYVLSFNLKARYLSYHSYGLSSKKLYSLVKLVDLKSKEGIYLQWQLALALYLEGKSKQSAKVLSFLSKSGQKIIKQDLISLTMARVLYGNNFLNLSIKYYKKIKQSSKYWFVAQEEMAWANLRVGKLEKSLEILTTTTKPMFYYTSLSESLFLKSLVELKTCNYLEVSKSISIFKKLMKQRIPVLEKIKSSPNTPLIKNWLNLVAKKDFTKLINLAYKTPSISPNDQRLAFLTQQQNLFFKEHVLAKNFFNASLSKGTGLGFQSFFKSLSYKLRKQSNNWKDLIFLEVKRLAINELAIIKQQIANLKVVELEMLQQVNTLAKTINKDKNKINKKLITQLKKIKKNTALNTQKSKHNKKQHNRKMYFSINSEVWLDELNNYNVKLNNLCNSRM